MCACRPMRLMRWARGPVGPWAREPMGLWDSEPVGPWARRPVGRGPVGPSRLCLDDVYTYICIHIHMHTIWRNKCGYMSIHL